jgi:ATP adenylyltransferase
LATPIHNQIRNPQTAIRNLVDRLFSPWRLAYVTSAAQSVAGCIFCDALAKGTDEPLIIAREALAYVILNLYPYNSGHLMVVPNRHVGSLSNLRQDELLDVMQLVQRAETALTEVYLPHGLNVGVNIGKAAGAGVADHLHVHLVPRWAGDTNFMSVVGEVRVLPEEVTVSAARLKPIFERLKGEQ